MWFGVALEIQLGRFDVIFRCVLRLRHLFRVHFGIISVVDGRFLEKQHQLQGGDNPRGGSNDPPRGLFPIRVLCKYSINPYIKRISGNFVVLWQISSLSASSFWIKGSFLASSGVLFGTSGPPLGTSGFPLGTSGLPFGEFCATLSHFGSLGERFEDLLGDLGLTWGNALHFSGLPLVPLAANWLLLGLAWRAFGCSWVSLRIRLCVEIVIILE